MREGAEIAAAWNLYDLRPDSSLLAVFIQYMSSTDKRIRSKAAYYVPTDVVTRELISGLQGMIRAEADTLAIISATNKLLECYGVTKESVSEEEFSRLYRGLRSADSDEKEKPSKFLS